MALPTSAVRSLSWNDTSAQLCSGCRNRTLASTCSNPHTQVHQSALPSKLRSVSYLISVFRVVVLSVAAPILVYPRLGICGILHSSKIQPKSCNAHCMPPGPQTENPNSKTIHSRGSKPFISKKKQCSFASAENPLKPFETGRSARLASAVTCFQRSPRRGRRRS